MSEKKVKLDDADRGTLKMADAFETMLRSQGWDYYKQILAAHEKTHIEGIMSPTTDQASMYKGERDKGALAGIRLALNIPTIVCAEAAMIRKNLGADPDGD